jgi:acetyl esterase
MESPLHPQMQKALELDAKLCAEVDCTGPSDLAAYRRQYNHARAWWNQGGPVMEESRDFVIDDIPCRIHRPTALAYPENSAPAILYLHGGGWVVGNLETHDRIMRELAHRTGFCVIGADYTLSPEVRFPVSHNQALTVLQAMLQDQLPFRIDSSRISICGDSAGAHMSLYCALKTKTSGVRSVVMLYGAFGLIDSCSRRMYSGDTDGLSEEDMDFYSKCLLGDGISKRQAGFDLLREDLSDLPACLITDCILDPLRDDSRALEILLTRVGVDCQLIEYDGVLHGYAHMSAEVDLAQETLQECANWIGRHS